MLQKFCEDCILPESKDASAAALPDVLGGFLHRGGQDGLLDLSTADHGEIDSEPLQSMAVGRYLPGPQDTHCPQECRNRTGSFTNVPLKG